MISQLEHALVLTNCNQTIDLQTRDTSSMTSQEPFFNKHNGPLIRSLKMVKKRSYKHASNKGSNCTDFLRINELSYCCDGRNDECYMHYRNTRCYCDMFCIEKQKTHNHNDCCPDAVDRCVFKLPNKPYMYKSVEFNQNRKILKEKISRTTPNPLDEFDSIDKYNDYSLKGNYSELRSKITYFYTNLTQSTKSDINSQFKHGNEKNFKFGGTCDEFFSLNSLTKCCANRNDDCYMEHLGSRCYCDQFCDRRPNSSDCCSDAYQICSKELS